MSFSLGPKELPRVGKALGKLTGKAAGCMYKARATMFQFAEQTELTKVQQELHATMNQLQAIRSELRGGIDILNPGPLTRRALGSVVPTENSKISNSLDTESPLARQAALQDVRQPLHHRNGPASFAASALSITAAAHPMTAPLPPNSAQNDEGAAAAYQEHCGSPLGDHPTAAAAAVENLSGDGIIPVSAVAAGLVPDRSAATPTGSEVLFDALQEERVAEDALLFYRSHNPQNKEP